MTVQVEEHTLTDSLVPLDLAYVEEHDNRLLIVDDEEQVRELFTSYLNERYSCVAASDAQQALSIMAKEPFALVISDVQMPGLGGIELLGKITELYPDTAVIMVSAIERTQRVLHALRLGAYDYIVKPCELEAVDLCVERALQRRTLLRNARRYKQELEHRNTQLARQQAELKRLQAQIVHSEKMASLGQLAAGIAHELNNPAGFIHANLEFLVEHVNSIKRLLSAYNELPLSPTADEEISALKREVDYDSLISDISSIVTDCYNGAERISDVVRNLRLFSRLDEAEVKRVDIHEGLESTIRLLSRYYTSGRIMLTRDYAELPKVECYAAQLNQVWMNLLVNAAQAMGDREGEVRVSTRHVGAEVVVTVADTGGGIKPDSLKKIFDPFFTTKAVGEGTGLGLSICHSIIERHGGRIEVESNVGAGTTFEVYIPITLRRDSFEN
jgi:two-component system, NtrC family, sensor kinase